ncbi:MAG: hypothetical protein P0Y56_06130 [Candidatus Andeanibacterium colombiense]|uniref:Leucyl aminopeptidase n=1 Tax=Candidatus Andeanibacterium colombiense TaxID=3121345 RepID=A0AAJ5XBP7_9SPHN|nr:MAG: hypothetical protein P0Y56_06130 [Sphingomonadaceae bacterium]
MGLEIPDIGLRAKPELIPLTQIIYRDMCNLQPGEKVLIISDARTPEYLNHAFQGMAMAMGADAVLIEGASPRGGATYQPSAVWSPMIEAASREADLIIDFGVGYAQFIFDALKRGARVFSPSDGIAMPYTDDVLIRTILHTDIRAVLRRAKKIAGLFTEAKTCRMITGDDTVLEIDIADVEGDLGAGTLWDPEEGKFITNWAFAPPSQPGILVPKGRPNGEVLVDGTLLYHPIYHAAPPTPLRLKFVDGVLTDIGGDPLFAMRLQDWLEELGDESARFGPVHLNIGVNPNALLTQHPEWERVLGSVTCGMGDLGMLSGMAKGPLPYELSKSSVHWDWTTLRPTVMLDDLVLVDKGRINKSLC